MNISQWKITDRSFFDFFASLGLSNQPELAAVQLWWLWWGRCHIPAACGYNAPRHNDARLRPIKLTENYIDDIFWARKFHAIRANGVDKISNSNDIE